LTDYETHHTCGAGWGAGQLRFSTKLGFLFWAILAYLLWIGIEPLTPVYDYDSDKMKEPGLFIYLIYAILPAGLLAMWLTEYLGKRFSEENREERGE
jgi:hypothetical protein